MSSKNNDRKREYTFEMDIAVVEECKVVANSPEEAEEIMLDGDVDWKEIKSESGDWQCVDSKIYKKNEENMNKTMCCSVCKQDNISWRVWADELNNVNGSCEDPYAYCDDCEDQTRPIIKDKDDN